jgi:hypothetical protein
MQTPAEDGGDRLTAVEERLNRLERAFDDLRARLG